jgi:PAS domain S-box-containing protein
MNDLSFIFPLLSGLIILYILAYVVGQRRKLGVNRAFILLFIDYLCLTLLECFLRIEARHPAVVLLLIQATGFVGAFNGFLFLNFVYAITDRKRDLPFQAYGLLALIGATLTLFPRFYITTPITGIAKSGYVPTFFFWLIVITVVVAPATRALVIAGREYRSNPEIRVRREFFYIITGLIVALGLYALFTMVIPVLFHSYVTLHYASMTFAAFALVLFRAISRHKFLAVDIEKTEAALQESESRFKAIFNATYQFTGLLTPEGIVLEANQTSLDFAGISLDDVINRPFWEARWWHGNEERVARLKNAIVRAASGEFVRYEVELQGAGATAIIIDFSLKPVVGPDNTVTMLVPEGRDITENKRAEKALRGSEEKFSIAFNTSPDSIMISRLADGVPVVVNQGFTNLSGYLAEEVVGRSALPGDLGMWVYKEDRDRLVAGLKATGEVVGLEVRLRKKNGLIATGLISASIIEMDGEPCILSTTRDISERKAAEAAIAASEAKYRELANSTPIGIFECDPAGNLTFVNTTLYEWFGYSQADFENGVNVFNCIDPRDHERVKAIVARASALTTSSPEEFEAIRPDGIVFPILIISRPIIHNNAPIGFRAILLDLTEKKRLESAMQNAARLESLGVLAGGIAHDFNNLLGGIFGTIDMANETSTEPEVKKYFAQSLNTIDRARGLTQQLLTFAKGGAPVKKIGPLFPFVRETAQFALSGSGVVCRFTVPGDLRHCSFDKNQIGQVIDNLVINAQQAMPLGGAIEVTARNVTKKEPASLPAGEYVEIAIKDSGIGIPREILPRIFDPFFTTKTKGHGLGLATCYSIVNRHGGCIEVESEPGRGSTFHLLLPASAETVATSAKETTITHRGSGTIVVMDDEEVIRFSTKAILGILGYTAVLKKEGREVIDFFADEIRANRPVVAMIFDITIPGGMGGLATIVEIRKMSADIPVFVASGYSNDPVMAHPVEYGFTASIRKPFRVSDVAAMLERCMGKK